jgi:hypothetical protein
VLVEAEIQDIIRAVKNISKNPSRYGNECFKRAALFDLSNFEKAMKKNIAHENCFCDR